MSEFLELLNRNFMELVVSLFLAFLAYLGKKFLQVLKENNELKKKEEETRREIREKDIKEQKEEQQAIKEGVLALLRFRINRLCIHIDSKQEMTIDEQRDLEELYCAYEKLGGNSRTHIMFDKIMKQFSGNSQ